MSDRPAPSEPISSAQADYDTLRYVSGEVPCPYLPGARSRNESYVVDDVDGATYERLLSRGYRRSGRVIYRPRCRSCRECRQLRVPVEQFTPTRSMRRVARHNADIRTDAAEAVPTDEKFALFALYLDAQHDATMSRSYETFVDFLYDSPVHTFEFRYYVGQRLIGVSIVDRCPNALSSVYMYFDPEHSARSLGTFSVLREIDHCRREDMPYYYLGFYVAGSRTMAYKSRFRPNEVLAGDDHWVSLQK